MKKNCVKILDLIVKITVYFLKIVAEKIISKEEDISLDI